MPRFERIKRRHLLKKRDQKKILNQIENDLGTPIKNLERSRLEDGLMDNDMHVLLLDGDIIFWESDGRMVPTLHALLNGAVKIPQVTVDMGAVKYVVNGADIMRPGITKLDDGIRKGSIVAIVDERHEKPIAIGISKMSSEEMRSVTHGKVILSLHYVGDNLWEFGKS